jgi:hypothetical protein
MTEEEFLNIVAEHDAEEATKKASIPPKIKSQSNIFDRLSQSKAAKELNATPTSKLASSLTSRAEIDEHQKEGATRAWRKEVIKLLQSKTEEDKKNKKEVGEGKDKESLISKIIGGLSSALGTIAPIISGAITALTAALPVLLPLLALAGGAFLLKGAVDNAKAIREETDPVKKQQMKDENQKTFWHRDLTKDAEIVKKIMTSKSTEKKHTASEILTGKKAALPPVTSAITPPVFSGTSKALSGASNMASELEQKEKDKDRAAIISNSGNTTINNNGGNAKSGMADIVRLPNRNPDPTKYMLDRMGNTSGLLGQGWPSF